MTETATPFDVQPGEHVTWSAEHFYWSVLNARPLGRAADDRRLLHLMEPDLPLPFEQVHAVFARRTDGSVIACAVSRDRLSKELPPGAASLRPASLPAFIACDGNDNNRAILSRLQLLTGQWEPRAVRRLRRASVAVAAMAVALVGLMMSIGVERRVNAASEAARETERARRAVLGDVLGESAMRPNADLLLASELSRLSVTHGDLAAQRKGGAGDLDASAIAEQVMTAWPRSLHVQVESLSITPATVDVKAILERPEDVQVLVDSLMRLGDHGQADSSSWSVAQPRVEMVRGQVQATIRLERSAMRRSAS